MKDQNEPKQGSAVELLVAGTSAILGLLTHPGVAAAGAIGSFSLLAWQNEQQHKFTNKLRQQIAALDQTKLDRDFIGSEDFIEVVFQATEAISKTASELKHRVLANALVSSVSLPTSQYSGKQTVIRLLAQMSDEEILALAALFQLENSFASQNSERSSGISTAEIAQQLGWVKEDAIAACEGLLQLGLVLDKAGSSFDSTGQFREVWSPTTLARRLVKFAVDRIDVHPTISNVDTSSEVDTQQAEETAEPNSKPIWELFEEFSGNLSEEVLAKLPTDGAEQHDYYVYGTAKRKP